MEADEATKTGAGAVDGRSDAVLVETVRSGDLAAYGVLYARHLGAARRIAGLWAASSIERDDAVAEAFARVLRALRSGVGPVELFRPYLVATMRNAVISWRRHDSAVSLVAEVPEPSDGRASAGDDPMDELVHAALAERWRVVLWHTEIEYESPAQVAPLLGLTPNGVSALAYRARAGLRKAFLARAG